jgi:hypothetical protein
MHGEPEVCGGQGQISYVDPQFVEFAEVEHREHRLKISPRTMMDACAWIWKK